MTLLEPQPVSDIEQGLDFLLGHFKEPVWPRKISTHLTEGRQVLVDSKTETLAWFKRASQLDCKINAYRWREEWAIELLGQAPEIIFADLDFKSSTAFETAVQMTVKNFREKLDGASPTIIHSGNGYHFIQPVEGVVLETESIFAELCENPSNKFHRFAEKFLTNNNSDPAHNPTFLSCMLRVPGSINSKNMAQVRIIQRWDGIRPAINWILRDYRRYLIQERFEEMGTESNRSHSNYVHQSNKTGWIETLLATSLTDHRKYILWRILAPYLINIKKLSYDEALKVTNDWLDKCGKLRPLNFNKKDRIKANLRAARRVGYLPIAFEKLKEDNKELHTLLSEEMRKHPSFR
jgi:Primase X